MKQFCNSKLIIPTHNSLHFEDIFIPSNVNLCHLKLILFLLSLCICIFIEKALVSIFHITKNSHWARFPAFLQRNKPLSSTSLCVPFILHLLKWDLFHNSLPNSSHSIDCTPFFRRKHFRNYLSASIVTFSCMLLWQSCLNLNGNHKEKYLSYFMCSGS
jgi:hypothetical protein